ncbi:MAG: response regulator, partial [Phycisphaerales bacterium]|nr:response regulator [Phycisphaerales bacterium]
VRMLQRSGYAVDLARDGREALTRMAAHKPDLVISDVGMPAMDGVALIKRMRQDPATAFIPVIILSEKTDIEARLAGFEAGIDDYVPKPFSIEEMLCRTQAVLKRAYF